MPRESKAMSMTPLLMIQGFACSGETDWGALPSMLANNGQRSVLTFDHRGINNSPAPTDGSKLEDFVEDTREVMESVGWARAHVMGISMGGMIAQTLAKETPELVASLTLGCTTPGGREAAPVPPAFLSLASEWASSDFGNEEQQNRIGEQFVRMMMPANLASTGPAGKGSALEKKIIGKFLVSQRSNAGLKGQLQAMGRFSSAKYLAELGPHRIPGTLVVHGEEDAIIPLENGLTLAEKIPGARLVRWQGAGHFFWLQNPVELVEEISNFLKEHEE